MTRDEKYLALCGAGAKLFSTCSRAHYMAIIISTQGRIVGAGYNGGPPGHPHCIDGACPRAQIPVGEAHGSSYDNCIAIHAEENALLWSAPGERVGATLYVNGQPCYGCAKKIAGSGIARVVYEADLRYAGVGASTALLAGCGVSVVPLALVT